ncbi:Cas10/Cmr2 second palm domain-containing protein [Streptomyces sp. T028]|uniref:Cas10/Cmr2 second palm domain-containing protein n=1 Tax=Streptomyces sp. T028 TaxID=3394379 RepID=UPI003A8774F0
MTVRHVYVDFGAVRIQQYLTRTPGLRGHRAASNSLARATAEAAIARVAEGLAEINPEAGTADGVISLRMPATETAGDDPAERVRRLQDRVFAHLRSVLPGAEFHSVWGEGESYLAVHAHVLQPRLRRGRVRHDLPPVAEFPLAVPCRMCHIDPAVGSEPVPDGKLALCLDCSMRNVPRSQTVADPLTPEGQLLREIGLKPAPEDFAGLAALGSSESGGNHLATVAVDGNAFGAFFTALADESAGDARLRGAKATISAALSAATRSALAHAALELPLTVEHERLCLVPHVVGGDDVLVSLPAEQAWRFTLTFLAEFTRLVRQETGEVLDRLNRLRRNRPEQPELEAPTASAGIVFAHASHPMNLLVESAGQRLSEAKRAFGGRMASVQWLDITADGPEPPAHPPLALSVLHPSTASAGGTGGGDGRAVTGAAEALSRLTVVPASHRARLTEAVRAHGPLTAAALADRVGHLPAIQPFLPLPGPLNGPFPSGAEAQSDTEPPGSFGGKLPVSGIGLEAALNLARWWPCA